MPNQNRGRQSNEPYMKQKHEAGAKRGKTRAIKSWFIYGFTSY